MLGPATDLPFINADDIAAAHWPGDEQAHAYAVARAAAEARAQAITGRRSFITETVFSHPSKVALVEQATRASYRVELHVMLIPEDVAVARVAYRVTPLARVRDSRGRNVVTRTAGCAVEDRLRRARRGLPT